LGVQIAQVGGVGSDCEDGCDVDNGTVDDSDDDEEDD